MQLTEGIFSRFFKNSLEIFCVFDSKWKFLKLNKMWKKAFGYTSTELKGKYFFDVVHPDDVSNTKKLAEGLKKNIEEKAFKNRIKIPGSTYKLLEWSFFFDGETIYASARDISQAQQKEKEQEEKVLKNQKWLEDSQRIGKMGNWEMDLKTNTVFWSESAYEIFGVNPKEKDLSFEEIVKSTHPDDLEKVKQQHEENLRKGKVNSQFRIIRPNGDIRMVWSVGEIIYDDEKNPARIIGIVQDITEQREIELEIKEKDEGLKRSEAILNVTMESIDDALLIVDSEKKVTHFNKSFARLFNIPKEILQTKNDVLFLTSAKSQIKNSEEFHKYVNDIYNSQDVIKDILIFKDERIIERLSYPLQESSLVKGRVWLFRDITKAKKNEENLKMFKISIDCSEDAVYWLNKNAEFEYINEHAYKSLGYTKEEMMALDLFDIDPVYTREKWDELWEGFQEHQGKRVIGMRLETFHKKKDGTIFPIEVVFNHLWINKKEFHVAHIRDISVRKQNEERLLKNQKMLSETQRIANIGSWELDLKNNQVAWSKQTYEIFGVKDYNKPITLDYFFQFVHPDDKENIKAVLNESLETKLFKNFECRIIRKDNKLITVLGVGEVLLDEAENPIYLVGAVQDISEQKQAEEEIRKLNAELEARVTDRTSQLNKVNRELEAFAYSVSHDLRAPIRHIDGFLRLMYSNISNPSEYVKTYYQKISSASKRMSVMIDGLLKFSRLGRASINFGPVDLSELINEIVEQLKPDYSQRKIKWEIKKLPAVTGDSTLLRLAFENLMSNAIKYTAEKEQAEIEVGVYNEQKESICIYIKDNGVGFDMTYKDKLFGVFQRLHSNDEFEGIGIGLANTKQIISKHNGKIDAVSELDKGAVFYVTLPILK